MSFRNGNVDAMQGQHKCRHLACSGQACPPHCTLRMIHCAWADKHTHTHDSLTTISHSRLQPFVTAHNRSQPLTTAHSSSQPLTAAHSRSPHSCSTLTAAHSRLQPLTATHCRSQLLTAYAHAIHNQISAAAVSARRALQEHIVLRQHKQ